MQLNVVCTSISQHVCKVGCPFCGFLGSKFAVAGLGVLKYLQILGRFLHYEIWGSSTSHTTVGQCRQINQTIQPNTGSSSAKKNLTNSHLASCKILVNNNL